MITACLKFMQIVFLQFKNTRKESEKRIIAKLTRNTVCDVQTPIRDIQSQSLTPRVTC
jgi:hypothetical protein